jgi:hypothetical protein
MRDGSLPHRRSSRPQNAPISLQALIDLRDQLKRVRAALRPLADSEESA